jgi:AbrB family looped-hinge helix DNA binding protein
MMEPVVFRIPDDMRFELEADARIHRTSLAEIIRRAVHQYAELIRQEEHALNAGQTAIVSRDGEIWMPAQLRDELAIQPGDEFEVVQEPDGIRLKRVPRDKESPSR